MAATGPPSTGSSKRPSRDRSNRLRVGLNRPEFSKRPGFRYLLAFERDGRQHTVPHMFALWIVEHFDVVEHVLAGLQAGFAPDPP